MKISAILLAAGLSRRMGTDKLLLPYGGKTVLQRAVDVLDGLDVFEKIIVTVPRRIASVTMPPGVAAVINSYPEKGQSHSVRLGVMSASDADMYLFLLADQPELTAECLSPLIDAALCNTDKIIYPVINGSPCSPALFPSRFRGSLLTLAGDDGGRSIRASHPDSCLPVEIEETQFLYFMDMDNIDDYNNLILNFPRPVNRF